MGTPDPYDWTRTTVDDRLAQARARQDRALAARLRENESPERRRRRYLVTGVMLLTGAFLLALSDLMARRGDSTYEAYRAAGWLLWFASIFVAKPRGWRIPVYLILTYFLVGMTSFNLYPLANIALHPQSLSAECRGWDAYVTEIDPIVDSINARDATLTEVVYASDAMLRSAIVDTDEVIRQLEVLDPPGAMEEYHENMLGMQHKWIDAYHATLDGQPTYEMLLDLHDDWVLSPYLRDQGNDKCASD